MMHHIYVSGKLGHNVQIDSDPGRYRPENFFKSVYGKNKKQVFANCRDINFFGINVKFNRRNNAAASLLNVCNELKILVKKKMYLNKYIFPLAGTLNWRCIAGTKRLSPHAYGIAIDLNSKYGYYWRTNLSKIDIKKKKVKYPFEIINVFEKNGFIWGGKWFHYDLMHFEYRPELIIKNRFLMFIRMFVNLKSEI